MASSEHKIRRKAVPNLYSAERPSLLHNHTSPAPTGGDEELIPPALPLRPARSLVDLQTSPRPSHQDVRPPLPLRPARSAIDLQTHPQPCHGDPPPPYSPFDTAQSSSSFLELPQDNRGLRKVKSSSALSVKEPSPLRPAISQTSEASSSSTSQLPSESKWKAAWGEAQYFAGGLLSKPAESTRHYSIVRHSHALVWYKGPSTSVTVSVLSDEPLPASRTIWLQQKGYSGNLGMSLKALVGTTDDWINVTPQTKIDAARLSERDERGYQRDLRRFAKAASGRQRQHVPRETLILRIPAVAADGYFRLVLCYGNDEDVGSSRSRKVLCGSPVFRVASTSLDSSVVKGASISTMPIEMTVKVGSFVGRQVANRYIGVAGAAVQTVASKAGPVKRVTKVGAMAYQGAQRTGLSDRVQGSWERGRDGRYDPMVVECTVANEQMDEVSCDQGPSPPFPIKFEGKVVRGSGRSTLELGYPTANLRQVPENVKSRMPGVFAAWVMILTAGQQHPDMAGEWLEGIVTIAPVVDVEQPNVVLKNKVTVHIIPSLSEGADLVDGRLKVLMMAFLHKVQPQGLTREQLTAQHARDIAVAMATLSRESWQPGDVLARLSAVKSQRSFSERLDSATSKAQQHMDRLPLHLAGIRSESSLMKESALGIGGIWIPR